MVFNIFTICSQISHSINISIAYYGNKYILPTKFVFIKSDEFNLMNAQGEQNER